MRERASELEFFKWFYLHADFGPASEDVFQIMRQDFMRQTGKNLPEGWNFDSDGETCMDKL